MDKNAMKDLIPVIKQQLPAIMAKDIANVQPMFLPFKSELICGTANLGGPKEGEWYTVRVIKGFTFIVSGTASPQFQTQFQWATDTFGADDNTTWFYREDTFYFRNESDRTVFVLKWSDNGN